MCRVCGRTDLQGVDGDGLGGGCHGVVVEVGHMEGEGDSGGEGRPACVAHHQGHQQGGTFLSVQRPPRPYHTHAPPIVPSCTTHGKISAMKYNLAPT